MSKGSFTDANGNTVRANDTEVPNPYRRTRFLPVLDEMIRTDRMGAIDDMLQVLRERGVTTTANASVSIDPRFWSENKDFISHIKKELANQIGRLIMVDGMIKYDIRSDNGDGLPMSFDPKAMVGTITIVKPKEKLS